MAIVAGTVPALAGVALIACAAGSAQVTTSALVILAAAVVQGVHHFAVKPLLKRFTGLEVACYAIAAARYPIARSTAAL
ncbi:hypothetical protein [Nonomuraea composti]|uniref:hypothetical protein n=1 Tax=Nonomuraea composti TaxID=2720023 RepID=UPI001980D771|nr:hypothetical protein [Nonomuraea sp. FMUSA5-5]